MRFNDVITVWQRGELNPIGKPTYSLPERVKARWEDRTVLFISPDGRSERSRAVVYVPKEFPTGALIKKGWHRTNTPPQDAYEVRDVRVIPNLHGTKKETRLIL